MSRFDNELVKHADNAYQLRGLSGQTTTPRQMPYDQVNTTGTDQAPGVTQAPAPVNETAGWVAEMPMVRQLDVRDLDAADPLGGQGEIIGGPGSSAVWAEGQPMYASVKIIDDSLYNVYKASRDIRNAINDQVDFDFSNLVTAANEAATVLRFASADSDVQQVIGTVASIVLDIENDLAAYGDYRQASVDLKSLEGLLQEIKTAATGEEEESDDDETEDDTKKSASKKSCKNCKGKGCDKCKKSSKGKKSDDDDEDDDEDDDDKPAFLKKKKAYNGNQESLQVVDVRDLDDQAGIWDRQRVMTPDHQTNVLVPEEVNGEDAGYVPFYNDGAETGITPGQEPHKQEVFPYDGTNPAFVPYQSVAGAVQASREKLFAAIQVVDRLEKLGMSNEEDRAKHIAKFEQMSNAKLAGFVASIDMLEESGARQPRSQKVASGSNRMPEMGRLTTASTVTRQDVQSDDWLMTL